MKTWNTKDISSLYLHNVWNAVNISARLSNEIFLVKFPAKGQRNKELCVTVFYVRLWLRQNNLPFENITIDKGCVNDLPVHREIVINPLSANPTKWSNTLKQFLGKLPTNCLSVLNHFVKLAFKGLKIIQRMITNQLLMTSFQIMS